MNSATPEITFEQIQSRTVKATDHGPKPCGWIAYVQWCTCAQCEARGAWSKKLAGGRGVRL